MERKAGKQIASWKLSNARSNFPMALDEDGKRLVVLTRRPARMLVFETEGGYIVTELEACTDADDVCSDPTRHLRCELRARRCRCLCAQFHRL